jgi:hypothetical protein
VTNGACVKMNFRVAKLCVRMVEIEDFGTSSGVVSSRAPAIVRFDASIIFVRFDRIVASMSFVASGTIPMEWRTV